MPMGPLKLSMQIERWPLRAPFRICGYTFEVIEVLHVTLQQDGKQGRGEATGVYFLQETPASMVEQIERIRGRIEAGITAEALQQCLPPGGARNALDCALWDLRAKCSGRPAWQLAGLDGQQPLLTTYGCGADTPENMAAAARAYRDARAIKIKLTGEAIDADRVCAVREARKEVWLAVDANQGFTRAFLEQLMPVLVDARVELIEQPFPVGAESLLEGFASPIPIAADESVKTLADMPKLAGRFSVLNIKLDKCGGLTEGLAMARAARAQGVRPMVGNMIGTSLAMAPAIVLGQLCEVVDLDGPLFLQDDRAICVQYGQGYLSSRPGLWG